MVITGGGFSYAARVNDEAQVAGFSDTGISTHAFRWTEGTGMVDLGALSGADDQSGALDQQQRWNSGRHYDGGRSREPARLSLDRRSRNDAVPIVDR